MEPVFFFEPETLDEVASLHRESFRTARPFPHTIIDGLIPDDVLDEVVRESPGPNERSDWVRADRADADKRTIPNDWTLGPTTRHLLNQFNTAAFINFLEQLTGITGLIPDPHYFGGGLHQIERGGFLKIHADFNWHMRLHLDRRLNALLYLNRDWQGDWGGHLELWNASMTEKVEEIVPLFNRLVVFATTDTSFHGHPERLLCPPGTRRRSLALYYYTNGRPQEEKSEEHSTLHQVRPGKDFALRAAIAPAPQTPTSPRDPNLRALKKPVTWRDFVPPIALGYAREFRDAHRKRARRKADH